LELQKEIECEKARQSLLSRGLTQREQYIEEAKSQVFDTLK
jgi:hypothetical protein